MSLADRFWEGKDEVDKMLDEAWWRLREFMFEFVIPTALFCGLFLLIMAIYGRLPLPW